MSRIIQSNTYILRMGLIPVLYDDTLNALKNSNSTYQSYSKNKGHPTMAFAGTINSNIRLYSHE